MLLADGATGTMLQVMGLEAGRAPETWLLERPEQIRALHQSYLDAGADLILTCTFGGTHYRLEGDGLGDRVREVNRVAAELAREVAGDRSFVVGDMGPSGQLLAPLGSARAEEVADAFAEQAAGLLQGGADLLLIETMSDLGEAQAAIEGAKRACAELGIADMPIVCTFSFDMHGRTMMGLRPALVAREIGPLVHGVGANCGREPAEFVEILAAMRAAAPNGRTDASPFLWAKPNAGLPHLEEDRVVYDASPEEMGRIAIAMRQAGAQVIGGCCGTGPEHVAAMAAALKSATPG